MKKILLLGLSLFLASAVAFAQGRKVTGIVSSGEDGEPIPGATVLVKGTSVGITTTYFNRERFVIPNSSYEDPENAGSYIENTNITVSDGGAGFFTDGSFRRNVAENYLVDGAYWKLREVAISYDFPASFMDRIGFIEGATLTAQGRNLLIFTPKSNIYTDPDYNFSTGNAVGIVTLANTPPTRFFGGSISLTF